MREAIPLLIVSPWIIYSDLRFHRIPNSVLLLLLLFIEINPLLGGRPLRLENHLFALATFFISCLCNLCLRGAIGMGDIKLFALSSLILDTALQCFDALLLASGLALLEVLITRRRVIPFGPPLVMAVALVSIAS
jgi:Flp pilus assembly protein protease CpaA